jgi:hypothetical protein
MTHRLPPPASRLPPPASPPPPPTTAMSTVAEQLRAAEAVCAAMGAGDDVNRSSTQLRNLAKNTSKSTMCTTLSCCLVFSACACAVPWPFCCIVLTVTTVTATMLTPTGATRVKMHKAAGSKKDKLVRFYKKMLDGEL